MKKRTIKDTHIYFPALVFDQIKELATVNRRSISAEIVIAVEKHVEASQPKQGKK